MERKHSTPTMLTMMVVASALTALLLSALFIVYINSDEYTTVQHTEQRTLQTDIGDFNELIDVIDGRFIGDFDMDEVINYAMRAAVYSLDDMWSHYMSPSEYEAFLATANNRYAGIGVSVVDDEETGGIRVLRAYPGSGAYIAGILVGDVIVAVDDDSIRGITMDEVRYKLRRPIGDTADITVLRDGEYHVLTVVYSIVTINPVTFEMLPGNIGYVRLRNFDEGAANNFIDAVNTLIDMGAVAFIYDVRDNGGGRVTEVTQILDFLLPEGEIFIAVDRSGVENITWSDEYWLDMPAVVLVNRYSFSGAEFFAAMLCEYDYAATVGEQTTGKNRMQSTIPLSNGGAVHISTGQYLTRNRVSLFDTGGFTPRHLIELTDAERTLFQREELDMEDDPQMQKALALLENYR